MKEIFNFINALYRQYGKQMVMEITITRDAGLLILSDLPRAYQYIDITGNWREFPLQMLNQTLMIRNGQYMERLMSFDSIAFDAVAKTKSQAAFLLFKDIEEFMVEQLPEGRTKVLAMTRAEEALMWINKSIRDEQTCQRST